MGARTFLRTSDISKLTLEYHNTHEYRRGGDQLDQPAHLALIAEQVDHNIHAGEATMDLWLRDRRDHLSIFAADTATNDRVIMDQIWILTPMAAPLTL